MSQELHYTSVPRGLKPGSRGFCTVATTPGMSGQLADRLESFTAYQAIYPPHDPAASRNPINFMHVKSALGGKSVNILSRVGPAELDYSGRSNKYAHHIVLEVNERPAGGPAWLMSQPGFLQEVWRGEPRELPERTMPPPGDRPPGKAVAWQKLTDDAGWAGALAESFLADPRRPAIIVFRPGMDLLPLFVEAIALLPPSRRWDVEFSTYFSTLPPGVNCSWRGVIENSPMAESALRLPGALVINLCRRDAKAEGKTLVEQARTGVAAAPPSARIDESNAAPDRGNEPPAGRRPKPDAPPPSPAGGYGGFPQPGPPRLTGRPPTSAARSAARQKSTHIWAITAGAVGVCIVGLAATAFVLLSGPGGDTKSTKLPQSDSKTATEIAKPSGQPEPSPTKVTQSKGPQEPASGPPAPEPAKKGDSKTNDTGQAVAVVHPPSMTEGERPFVESRTETHKDLAVKPETDVRKNADPPGSKPEIKSPKNEAKPVEIRSKLLDFAIPKVGSADSKTWNLPDNVEASGLKEVSLHDLGDDSLAKLVPEFKPGQNALFEVRQKLLGDVGDPVSLARFEFKGKKVEFSWAENADQNNPLANCLLELKTDKNRYFALLTKPPSDREKPLKIPSPSKRGSNAPVDQNGQFTRTAPWDASWLKKYRYLKGSLRILGIRSKVDGAMLRFVADPEKKAWTCRAAGDSRIDISINEDKKDSNVYILFSYAPSSEGAKRSGNAVRREPTPKASANGGGGNNDSGGTGDQNPQAAKATVLAPTPTRDDLLGAEYDMILGWKLDGQEVEFTRTRNFEDK
jgi:GTPase-associated protein 1, N-terminal domain type 2/GTPase-associated protein 1, middle domain